MTEEETKKDETEGSTRRFNKSGKQGKYKCAAETKEDRLGENQTKKDNWQMSKHIKQN